MIILIEIQSIVESLTDIEDENEGLDMTTPAGISKRLCPSWLNSNSYLCWLSDKVHKLYC